MSYTIRFEKQAKKDLEDLNKGKKQRIITKLEWFAERPERSKNVKYIDKYNCLRYRIGDFRIFFEKNNNKETISILTIEKRSKAYK